MPSGLTRDYYGILGVASDAAHESIRRAYLDQARHWHPDAFADQAASVVAEAEQRMRDINEAWHVLGSAPRRRAYDGRRSASPRPTDSGVEGIRVDDGITRIDPRLLDPDFIAARRYAQLDEISIQHGMIVRALPLLAVLALLGGILVVTAYAAGGGGEAETTVTSVTLAGPSLGSGIDGGDCVSVASGPSLIERPCDALAAGRVIAAHQAGGATCPEQVTIREVELTNGWTACLGLVGG